MKYPITHTRMVLSNALLLMLICGGSNSPIVAQKETRPSVRTTQLAEDFYQISVHNFVNMLVFNGPEGAVLVDTGFGPVDLIEAELKRIGVDRVRVIVNTHSHGDHVEGNARLGPEAVIISSRRSRDVLLEDDEFPESGLPNLTFSDSVSIHINDETVSLFSMPGHSDSDVVVHFAKANIVCIGDYGFFDSTSTWPGSSANVYDMEQSMVRMTKRFSDDAIIVSGHATTYTMPDLRLDTELITEAISLVRPLVRQGLPLDRIKERNPLEGSSFSLVRDNAERWIESIYGSSRLKSRSDRLAPR